MQKTLKSNNFMNEMHENEFESFSKTFVFNPKLQKQYFHTFCPKIFNPMNTFCIKIIRVYILEWPNQIHTKFHILSLAKNNL